MWRLVDIINNRPFGTEHLAAIRKLGDIGATAGAPALVAVLTDTDTYVAETRPDLDPEGLSGYTEDPPARSTRQEAALALKKIGSGAVPTLIAAIKDSKGGGRSSAANVLAKIEPLGLSALISALKDAEPAVRSISICALAEVGRKTIPALISAFGDSEPSVRSSAIGALTLVGPVAVPALVSALRDAELSVQSSAADTLAKIGERAGQITAVKGSKRFLRSSEFQWHTNKVSDLVASLIDALDRPEKTVRLTVIGTLGKIGPAAASAVPAFAIALKDLDLDIRLIAENALATILAKPTS